jgi:hypothetical protein
VICDDHVHRERPRVRQRVPKDACRGDRAPVVTEHPHPCGDHLTHLGERLPFESFGDGSNGEHIGAARRGRLLTDLGDDRRVIGDGVGIGHRAHRRVPADRGRARTRGDGLFVFLTRLPQVGMHIDQSRGENEAFAVDEIGVVRRRTLAHAADDAICHPDIGDLIAPRDRVEQPGSTDQDGLTHLPPPLPRRRGGGRAVTS